MKVVVGLGNPGERYARTRHNVGFMAVDALFPGARPSVVDDLMVCTTGQVGQQSVVAIKPMTWMNRSGLAVQAAVERFGCGGSELIVVHDDLDLPAGSVRIKVGGGHGGHNGLRSLLAVATEVGEFVRVRIGVGRDPNGVMDAAQWVLAAVTGGGWEQLQDAVARATQAVIAVLTRGPQWAMNELNRKSGIDPGRARDETVQHEASSPAT